MTTTQEVKVGQIKRNAMTPIERYNAERPWEKRAR